MFGGSGRPCVKVCCGPRCGVYPAHRAVYEAVEATALPGVCVVPTMCRGLCGEGVTVVRANGDRIKARDADDACRQLNAPSLEEM
jgi:hypothetical protein